MVDDLNCHKLLCIVMSQVGFLQSLDSLLFNLQNNNNKLKKPPKPTKTHTDLNKHHLYLLRMVSELAVVSHSTAKPPSDPRAREQEESWNVSTAIATFKCQMREA